jgi:precorrin-2 dehydrogenase/sirohydrochlorin ferrochelatase
MAREGRTHLPLFLDVHDRKAVVVGGGEVAERKARALLECGARVTVVAPEVTPALARLAAEGCVAHEQRAYREGDLEGAAVAFVAVDDAETSARAASDARAVRVPVNVADRPEMCDLLVPSVLRRGRLAIAVSTGGASPAWARRLRERLEGEIGPEWGRLMDALASVRAGLMEEIADPRRRREALLRLADDACLELARGLEGEALEAALLEIARGKARDR